MSADPTTARANITARLVGMTIPDAVLPVSIFRGIPDEVNVPKYTSGKIKPYGVIKFAGPIPTARGRGMALGEAQQPQIMALTFVGYGATQLEAEQVCIAGTNLLLGFECDSGNATPLAAAGGYSFNSMNSANVPTRFEEACSFQCVLNQSVDFAA